MITASAQAFYIMSAIALIAALLAVTRRNAIHALMYMVLLFLALGGVFYVLGAPFAAVVQVIIYAGAIMVLFVFAIMVLNPPVGEMPRGWRGVAAAAGPAVLALALVAALTRASLQAPAAALATTVVGPKQVAETLFGTYAIGVELASMLLLAGLIGAYHLGRRATTKSSHEEGCE